MEPNEDVERLRQCVVMLNECVKALAIKMDQMDRNIKAIMESLLLINN